MRLTGASQDVYKYLEPLLNDYRKLRMMNRQGRMYSSQSIYRFELHPNFVLEYVVITVDEYIDNLLREERYIDVILPRIQVKDSYFNYYYMAS